ncbi:hypothetical protein BABA_03619 [Neobacillus bataviensis LMG 21833]|uniref:Uncharacterized protein n=1 Tax=Neobacillus bataviensis LMG 21833 TaxID=1117379 RepID=K6DRF6_9BACI|nr:DUF6155 family protein [Neobacillus bataviensis]EKN70919.1 hypothetical protein BABA_03619 [Neobacillus bataviensis LMG 21833]
MSFSQTEGDSKLRFSEEKKEITGFKKATNDERRTVDLMLFYVEQGVEFTSTFGYINERFYSSMVNMFDQVAIACDRDEELFRDFSSRIKKVLEDADGIGWGFDEALVESFYTINWVDVEEDE